MFVQKKRLPLVFSQSWFHFLTVSQEVDLKSGELDHVYCCELSCWKKQDLFKLGTDAYNFQAGNMEEWFYSGGNVREFTRPTVEDIRIAVRKTIDDADLDYPESLLRD
ncbi:Crinkler (CRN) [Phytophthora megakarya]|uniref:Crinkler (CRN) n=1 Tax=Phytophthora megakarya TaxID=4795 RepID=A0A225UMS7_9STRA|nr:Crinkler (CRN) [Phytophthora megakarya]